MVKQALISANGNIEQPARVQEPIDSQLQLNQAEGKEAGCSLRQGSCPARA